MSENIYDSDERAGQQKDAIKKDAKGLFKNSSGFLKGILDFRSDTDRESTIELIKADISIKGATAWILICSIFIASIGLNANSIPVVIGAMLISPLMGPILGIGMSIAVNDIDTLRRSLANFTVMVVLSVLTAWLFFFLFPLKVESSELLARTKPDIRDVLIAFFGGLALIIARTKKGTIASVIFGVAIATALMPPLCTVGFGLAIGKYEYAWGAMYLFTINTIFIALATFLVLKLLRFPMLRYANSARRKFVARLASFVALLVMVPAIYAFWLTLNESQADGDYKNFITQEIELNENLFLRKEYYNYDQRTIKLIFDGELSEATMSDLRNEVQKFEYIKDFELVISGNEDGRGIDFEKRYNKSLDKIDKLENTNDVLNTQVTELKATIKGLEAQLLEANKVVPASFSYASVAKDAKIRFPNLEDLGYGKVMLSDFRKVDTLKVLFPKWKNISSQDEKQQLNDQLQEWIASEVKADKLYIFDRD